MKKLTLALLILMVFSLVRLNSESKPKSASKTKAKSTEKELTNAYEIFNKYKAVTNYDSLKNINGFCVDFSSKVVDLKTTLKFWYLRPDNMKLKFRVRNSIITVVYDGKQGWSKNSLIGVIPIQPTELPMLHKFALFVDGPLFKVDTATWKLDLKLDSAYDVDGRPAYKIIFTDPKGITTDCYFSKTNYQIMKAQFVTTDSLQPVLTQVYYSDYKKFDNGLIVPSRMDYISAGMLEELGIDSIESGMALNHKDFLKPF